MKYPEHPCMVCKEPTTNKNYCPKCLKVITTPFIPPRPSKSLITAERPKKLRQVNYRMGVSR